MDAAGLLESGDEGSYMIQLIIKDDDLDSTLQLTDLVPAIADRLRLGSNVLYAWRSTRVRARLGLSKPRGDEKPR